MSEENLIRDNLAKDLSIIEPGLTFLQKEYHLPNYSGSKGYVDILATDVYNNYVVIEIKRSKASSRETMQEIIKYAGLLKQNFKARDSEIRVIILSTHWEELFIPYCELHYQSTLRVQGFEIFLDEKKDVIKCQEKQPETIAPERRRFAPTYELAFFITKEKRDAYYPQLASRLNSIGIENFVIVSMSLGDVRQGIYPFGTCLAFNETTSSEYLSLPEVRQYFDKYIAECKKEDDLRRYLEQCVLCSIKVSGESYEGMEIGSPEKMQSILGILGWRMDEIHRYGFFKSDPRLTDTMLIKELKGYDGRNKNTYNNYADSVQKDRIKEVIESLPTPFLWREKWRQTIINLSQYIQEKNEPFRIVVNVYSPDSIFYALNRLLKYKEFGYLPCYTIFVDFYNKGELQVFTGRFMWNGGKVDEKAFYDFMNDNTNCLITKAADASLGSFNDEIMNYLNLDLSSNLTTTREGRVVKNEYFNFSNSGQLQIDQRPHHNIVEWVINHFQLGWVIMQMHDANTGHA